jgi:hypothetical protein
VIELPQCFGFGPQDSECGFLGYEMRAKKLGDDDTLQLLVEREVSLVLMTSTEQLKRVPLGGDLISLL